MWRIVFKYSAPPIANIRQNALRRAGWNGGVVCLKEFGASLSILPGKGLQITCCVEDSECVVGDIGALCSRVSTVFTDPLVGMDVTYG